jgi:hypothetical protein
MANTKLQLPYGIKGGVLTHVSQVPSGIACNCTCPACDAPLVAKKGHLKLHHFAHAKDSDCASALETALHLAAKSILSQRRQIVLPEVKTHFWNSRYSCVLAHEQTYFLERVDVEKRVGLIIPDLLVYIRGRPIAIEVRVTHAVDKPKSAHYRSLSLSALEIDLSQAPRSLTFEELEPLVVGPGPHKMWVLNAAAERKRKQILSTGRVLRSARIGYSKWIVGCPVQARVRNGIACAHPVGDCTACEYLIEFGSNMNSVTCSAAASTPKSKRIRGDA